MIPGLGRSPGGGHGSPLQCSCLENPMDRGSPGGLQSTGSTESDMTERLSPTQRSEERDSETRDHVLSTVICSLLKNLVLTLARDPRPGGLACLSRLLVRLADDRAVPHRWVCGWEHRPGSGARRPWGALRAERRPCRSWRDCKVCAAPTTVERLKEHRGVTGEPPWEAPHAAAAGTACPWAEGPTDSLQLYPA